MDWTHLCSCRLIIPAPVRAFAYSGAHKNLIQFLLHADGEKHQLIYNYFLTRKMLYILTEMYNYFFMTCAFDMP
jgi:hypothetical protein